MSVKDILQEAIGTGELLTIVYNGGSQPGSTRMISPIKIEDNNVRARCYTSNTVKAFMIKKIEISENHSGETSYKIGTVIPETNSLVEAITPHIELIKNLGWHIELDDSFVGLYRFYKNGKMRKSPDVLIELQKYNLTDDFFENPTNYTEKPLNKKPWYTSSMFSDKRATSYKYLSKSVNLFLEFAKEGSEKYALNTPTDH